MKTQEGIVEGYRLYSIVKGIKGDYLLGSLSENIIIPRRVNKARHVGGLLVSNKEVCPHVSNGSSNLRCGFNMFKYQEYINSSMLEESYHGYLVGKGWGWGKVVPGTKGFRCQFFYPKSIFGVLSATSYASSSASILSLESDKLKVIKGRFMQNYTLLYSEHISSSDKELDIEPLELLWKIARLYKIKLEFELPEWANKRMEEQ